MIICDLSKNSPIWTRFRNKSKKTKDLFKNTQNFYNSILDFSARMGLNCFINQIGNRGVLL